MRQAVTVERWIEDEATDVLESLASSHWETLGRGELSTEHAASSQGLPVLVVNGQALGCEDLPEGAVLRPVWTEWARGSLQPRARAKRARVWWFGFDCGHAYDAKPGLAAHYPAFRSIMPGGQYRDMAYARAQTEHLAQQLAEVARGD